ncbi:MAG: ABC transporter permease [Propionibacteriaceae bacterium]|nr:ABC transporter permease [Propionibacteriaceae bacterium]
MPVARALLRRLAVFVASLLVASVVVFGLINLLPGDVAGVILGSSATPDAIEALRQQMGLNVAAPLRYLRWMGGLLHGDLGRSALSNSPIGPLVASTLGVTFSLVVLAMIVAVAVALPLGAFSAMRRRRASGTVVSALSQLGMSVPAFLVGLALVMLFAVKLHWLPANGYTPLTQDPLDWLRRLVLPVLALGIVQAAVLVRYVRGAFVDVLNQDYFRTARAVGWTNRRALMRHGMRNAGLQIITVVGLQLATLLVGAVVIESVFVLPGMGKLLLDSVATHDLPVVQAIVMVLVALILAINAIVDMAYAAIDPRLRSQAVSDADEEADE